MELFYKTDFDPEIKRAEQGELSRLAFLEKLCKDYGLIVKFADNQIIIVEESALESAESVETFTPDKIKKISFKSTLTEIYKACELNYNHGEHKELYSARVEDATKADGKTLKINRRVNSQTEAEHLAANELREKNKDENKMSLTVRGNFNLSAGSVISIEDFGAFSGRYLLEKVTHKVGSSGYETSATAHLCLDLKG